MRAMAGLKSPSQMLLKVPLVPKASMKSLIRTAGAAAPLLDVHDGTMRGSSSLFDPRPVCTLTSVTE
jgi:hypothetical protein